MIKNAFAYVTRKSLKSLIIMLVILSMSILSFISLSLKDATDRASKETDRKSTRLNSSHYQQSRMPSSA